MKRVAGWLAGALMVVGCDGPAPVDLGEDMSIYFPFEQNLDCRWDFDNEEFTIDHSMVGEITDFLKSEDGDEYEVSLTKDCKTDNTPCVDGEVIRRTRWEVDRGVFIQSVQTVDEIVTFDTPVQITEARMKPGEPVETVTNGATYSSVMSFEDCPTRIQSFINCVRLDVTRADGVSDPVTGSYWAINDFNVVAMSFEDQPGQWQITNHVEQ